ncbi:MAG: DUF1800 family protein [Acidimicrobiia bacterium]|jgi:uncharacterized protein (DUF1800 family)|nr:DUF1800 family protein [Acidimicrobiia bacterium]
MKVESLDRLRTARLVHRVGFGPRPGQFRKMLNQGFKVSARQILRAGLPDYGDIKTAIGIADVGAQPKPDSDALVPYNFSKRAQLRNMSLWWLDQMVVQEHPFVERMTWFWHGHWATSYSKVNEPVVMFDHIARLRKHAIGDFSQMCEEMILDGALIYWLDGQLNTASSPNENLARELLELFTLGVNHYSENDVKEAAKALSGMRVVKNSGLVTKEPRRSYFGTTTILGVTGNFESVTLARFLSLTAACQRFIPERLMYRFISPSASMMDIPKKSAERAKSSAFKIHQAFGTRQILPTMEELVFSDAFKDPVNAQVKSPVEWLVSVFRALQIVPSTCSQPDLLLTLLDTLGQRPFFPPNVSGWPADEAWLSVASSQNLIRAAQIFVSEGDLSPLIIVPKRERVDALADWLGVAEWSDRTRMAFEGALGDAARLTALAICSPEYLVSM